MEQQDVNDKQDVTNASQIIKNTENTFFKWVIGILMTILFTFVSIIYNSLKLADATTATDVQEIKSHETSDNERFQNLESNVYLLCKSQKLDCIPPVK